MSEKLLQGVSSIGQLLQANGIDYFHGSAASYPLQQHEESLPLKVQLLPAS